MKKILVISLLFLTSCSFFKETRINNAMNEGKKYLADERYREAIQTCHNSLKAYPESLELKNFCMDIFMNIKAKAEGLYKKGEYKKAGILYRYLIEYKPVTLRIEAEKLQSIKTECIKRLSEKALLNYRNGYIEEAIATWNDILEIDPSDSEAKKAIATASMQLKNIKELQR